MTEVPLPRTEGDPARGESASCDAVIEVRRVCRRVSSPERWLLKNVSLRLLRGNRLVITGPSGSGKSLLLRAVGMLDGIDGGEILWRGSSIHGGAVPHFRSHVIYLHQHPSLLEGSVRFNLEMPFRLKQHRHGQLDIGRITAGLRSLDRSEEFLDQSVRSLSGGERQCVALLRVLQLNPEVLLVDEPTAAADTEMTHAIERLVLQWADQEADRALIWVTHNESQAARIAQLRLRMDQGELLEV